MRLKKNYGVALIALSVTVLIACGESDLAVIEQNELDLAEQQVELTTVEPQLGAARTGVDLSQFDLIFSDEFNGSAIDADKWNTAYQWGDDLVINDELQYYVDIQNAPDFAYNPFSFDGESLVITAIETPAELIAAANNQAYLSGVLTTSDKFDMTFGYIEARIDFPQGTGLWPAFWMLSSEFVDLKPQLFIAEANGAKPSSVFHNYNYHDDEGNLRTPGQLEISNADFADGFHTLAVSWEPEELLFFIDGEPRYRIIGENVSSQAMYMLLNLAVGGVWVGTPDSQTAFPTEVKIDYVRAYQRKQ